MQAVRDYFLKCLKTSEVNHTVIGGYPWELVCGNQLRRLIAVGEFK